MCAQQVVLATDNLLPSIDNEGSIMYRVSTAATDLTLAETQIKKQGGAVATNFVASEVLVVTYYQLSFSQDSMALGTIIGSQLNFGFTTDLSYGNTYQLFLASGTSSGAPASFVGCQFPGGPGSGITKTLSGSPGDTQRFAQST